MDVCVENIVCVYIFVVELWYMACLFLPLTVYHVPLNYYILLPRRICVYNYICKPYQFGF